MSPSGTTSLPQPAQDATTELRASLYELLAVQLDRALGIALDKVEDLADGLENVAASGGVGMSALLGGVVGRLGGRNVAWSAIRGAFSAMTTAQRAGVVLALTLAVVLLPVAVLVALVLVLLLAVAAMAASASDS